MALVLFRVSCASIWELGDGDDAVGIFFFVLGLLWVFVRCFFCLFAFCVLI